MNVASDCARPVGKPALKKSGNGAVTRSKKAQKGSQVPLVGRRRLFLLPLFTKCLEGVFPEVRIHDQHAGVGPETTNYLS